MHKTTKTVFLLVLNCTKNDLGPAKMKQTDSLLANMVALLLKLSQAL